MNSMFLVIEARRHSLFVFSQQRVIALERGFFAHMLLADVLLPGSSPPMPHTHVAPPPPPPTLHRAVSVSEMGMATAGMFTAQLHQWDGALKMLMLAPPDHIQRVTWPALYFCITHHFGFLFAAVYIGWLFKVSLADEMDQATEYIAVGVAVGAVVVRTQCFNLLCFCRSPA
jgi:uncharacterized membrane protein